MLALLPISILVNECQDKHFKGENVIAFSACNIGKAMRNKRKRQKESIG
jgi:hypothetical protein